MVSKAILIATIASFTLFGVAFLGQKAKHVFCQVAGALGPSVCIDR